MGPSSSSSIQNGLPTFLATADHSTGRSLKRLPRKKERSHQFCGKFPVEFDLGVKKAIFIVSSVYGIPQAKETIAGRWKCRVTQGQ